MAEQNHNKIKNGLTQDTDQTATVLRYRTEPGPPVETSSGAHRCRVLFIQYHFPPSMGVGAQSSAQNVRYLPLHGVEPVVLTAHPRYYGSLDQGADDDDRGAFRGRVIRTAAVPHPYVVYRFFRQRLRSATDRNLGQGNASDSRLWQSAVGRWALSLLETPDIYTGWFIPAVASGLGEIRRSGVNHLLSSAPCWTNHLVGLALSRLTGLPWIAHFRDPWTQVPQWKPTSHLSARIEATLERMVVRHASSVVCVTDRHTALLQQCYPDLPPGKFITIPNGYDEAEWESVTGAAGPVGYVKGSAFVITYTGTFYQRRNPYPLFRALRCLVEGGDIDLARVRIDLIGWCEAAEGRSVRKLAEECGLSGCVNIIGPLGRASSLRRLVQSDLLLILAEGWTLQVPAKTYEYLRAGRPILALTSEGALADLLRKTGGAWVVDPGNEDGIVDALREAYYSWFHGRVAREPDRDLVAEFDRRQLARRFAELLTQSRVARAE